jgi:segregation and condensation protein B
MGQPANPVPNESDLPRQPDTADGATAAPLTLNRLTAALAEMLGPPIAAAAAEPSAAGEPAAQPARNDDCCPITPRSVLEALLFVGNPGGESLRPEQVAEWVRDVEPAEVEQLVEQLNQQYAAEAAAYSIVADGAGYRLSLTPEFQGNRRRLSGRSREARLSQAAVEVLALVAYNQPIPSAEIGRLRGRPSSHILAHLVRRQLLRIERKPERPRSLVYHTTPRFLSLFGLSDISELPQAQELG